MFTIKKEFPQRELFYCFAWQRPTLAGSDPPTTIGAKKLDFCVRNGNRYILLAIVTTLCANLRYR